MDTKKVGAGGDEKLTINFMWPNYDIIIDRDMAGGIIYS